MTRPLPEPGHVEILARDDDGTLTRWTASYVDAGLNDDTGVLGIIGEAWHREVNPASACDGWIGDRPHTDVVDEHGRWCVCSPACLGEFAERQQ